MSVVILARGGARLRATDPPPPVLGTIDDLAATAGDAQVSLSWTPAENATSHQIQYRAGTSGSWSNFGSPLGGSADSGTVTGLDNDTSYQFRIAASDGNTTTTSNVASATPEGAGAVEPAFADGFESGDVSHSENGFGWNGGGSRVVTTLPRTGAYSMWFPYGPTTPGGDSHWWSETRFSLAGVQEFWAEWYFWLPENYTHYSQGAANNNKFFAWWGPEGYQGNHRGAYHLWTNHSDPGDSYVDTARTAPGGSVTQYPGDRVYIFGPEHRGQWHQIRIHNRLSDPGQANGIQRLWRNGELLLDDVNDSNEATDPENNVYADCYFMGWDNGAYQEQTNFYIDDVKFYTSDPGW